MNRERLPVIFLTGAGRSGTTLLERRLAGAFGFLPVGEFVYFGERALLRDESCSCGAPFSQCPFWTTVLGSATASERREAGAGYEALRAAEGRMRHYPRNTVLPKLRRTSRLELGNTVGRWLRLALEHGAGEGIVDSSKDPSYGAALVASEALSVHVVHVVRDSRAVAYSWTRRVRRPEIHWRAEDMPTYGARHSASEWVRLNALAEGLRLGAASYTRVRYEDAASNETAMQAFMERLALRAQLAPAEMGCGPGLWHTVSGNPIRFESGTVSLRPDESWRQGLGGRDFRIVTALTAVGLLRYSYPLARTPRGPR